MACGFSASRSTSVTVTKLTIEQQIPGAELGQRDHLELVLTGIGPGTGHGADVFGDPEEEGGWEGGQRQRHPARQAAGVEPDPCAPEDQDGGCEKRQPDVGQDGFLTRMNRGLWCHMCPTKTHATNLFVSVISRTGRGTGKLG